MKKEYKLSINGIDQLRATYEGFDLYQAGQSYPGNFSRDSIITALLKQDSEMLKNQLSFCAEKQGTKNDPLTGEEPGKIHHEFPGFKMPNGLYTTYNACDTDALYLRGHDFYQKQTKDESLAEEQKENIEQAIKYIRNHIDENGFFIEDPRFCGNDKFALKVTYWKDSCLIDRANGTPVYPIVYTLAHIQNLDGLRKAQNLLDGVDLSEDIKKMESALPELYDDELNTYYIAIDKQGPVRGISSDSLHSFYYLDRKDITREQLKGITKSSEVLETPIGYRTLDPALASKSDDPYHSKTVWVFEQAMIDDGSRGLGIERPKKISSRIIPKLPIHSELFTIDDKGNANEGGCNPQLWSIAAEDYFESSRPSY
ncbi:MAG: hypothetical protein KAT28_05360 [Candidatus Aenigmarchaeota archaeon]|nr:hypothetical protein [Candidatus Aenigmarchaeota archaeon]